MCDDGNGCWLLYCIGNNDLEEWVSTLIQKKERKKWRRRKTDCLMRTITVVLTHTLAAMHSKNVVTEKKRLWKGSKEAEEKSSLSFFLPMSLIDIYTCIF